MTPHFTTPCYVRVEDKDKRKKVCEELEKMERVLNPIVKEITYNTIIAERDCYYDVADECIVPETIAVNCGTNTALFLALAGMRNDTDKGQWFVSHGFKLFDKLKGAVETSTGRKAISAGEWFKPLIRNIKFKWLGNHGFHRATAAEILEHFKNK